jgi:hypothetical protein
MTAGCVVVLVMLLAGVGVAALLARRGAAAEWNKWSDVGQTFGALSSIISGLALAAVVITARMQFQEMRQSRAEMEYQRHFLMDNHLELQRTAAANLGQLHLEILKLSIEDASLAEVWPPFEPNITPSLNRQYIYANIIYQFNLTSLRTGGKSDEEVIANLRLLFSSPLMRGYWKAAAKGRKVLPPDSPEMLVAQTADAICQEYETVVANAARETQQGPTSLHDRHNPPQAA